MEVLGKEEVGVKKEEESLSSGIGRPTERAE
jgi:hypothetical protein